MSTADMQDTNGNDLEAFLKLPAAELEARMMDSSAPDGDTATAAIETDADVVGDTKTDVKEGDTAQADSTAAPAAAKVEEEAKPEGVLAKDEKHILPFKVVEDLRTRNAELERVAREQAQQIEALNKAKAPGAKDVVEIADTELLSDEQLAELEAELPALAKSLRVQQTALRSLLAERATEKQQRDEQEQQRVQSERERVTRVVQEAIDATPKLAYLQTTDPVAFERAKEIDIARASNPKLAKHWNALSLAERFAQVMTDYEAKFGAVEVAALPEKDSPAPATTAAAPAAKPTQKSVPAGPLSLSDLPGGAAPAVDSRAEMASRTGAEIASHMAKWTPAQLEAHFAQL